MPKSNRVKRNWVPFRPLEKELTRAIFRVLVKAQRGRGLWSYTIDYVNFLSTPPGQKPRGRDSFVKHAKAIWHEVVRENRTRNVDDNGDEAETEYSDQEDEDDNESSMMEFDGEEDEETTTGRDESVSPQVGEDIDLEDQTEETTQSISLPFRLANVDSQSRSAGSEVASDNDNRSGVHEHEHEEPTYTPVIESQISGTMDVPMILPLPLQNNIPLPCGDFAFQNQWPSGFSAPNFYSGVCPHAQSLGPWGNMCMLPPPYYWPHSNFLHSTGASNMNAPHNTIEGHNMVAAPGTAPTFGHTPWPY